ncbi:MAG: glycosyltransferase family 2 protein [Candidatus Hydrogenedentes bacterium]|nr:glycosyltransferase family 2 protein [Candidatus Hydrogenedentota bacterium]
MGTIEHDIAFLLREVYSAFMDQLGNRPLYEWFLFFFPFFVFGEIPRYIIPALIILGDRIFGLTRENEEAKKRFMLTTPSVSVLLVGYNEAPNIANAIESLIEFDYPAMEIIVVDDGSTDGTYQAAKPYADRGLIKLYRNNSASGRSGRPAASNMALQLATGDFILSVDADTSFDHDALDQMIAPFHDPEVGVVAGNLKPRNADKNLLTRMQALEYLQSITLWKSWLELLGWNMQASGAFGAFRREALQEVAAWDPELAEDADLSLKLKKAGWKIVFASKAIAMTNVPEDIHRLVVQRHRWDRGLLRTYFRKHISLMKFWQFDWRNTVEMSLELVFSVLLTVFYVIWFVFMCIFFPTILLFAIVIMYFIYIAVTILTVGVAISTSERGREEISLLLFAPVFPLYKSFFRWVRLYSFILEYFRLNYEQSYLPESAWRNARKW